MQVGKTKDQGLYNKPSAALQPWALAAGTLPQYSIINFSVPDTATAVGFAVPFKYLLLSFIRDVSSACVTYCAVLYSRTLAWLQAFVTE